MGMVWGVLAKPRQTFAALPDNGRRTWIVMALLGMILVTLPIIASGPVTAQQTRELLQEQFANQPGFEDSGVDAEQAASLAASPIITTVVPAVFSAIGLIIGWLIWSGALYLLASMVGGRSTFLQMFQVVIWAWLPFALRNIVQGIYITASQALIANPGLSGFAGAPAPNPSDPFSAVPSTGTAVLQSFLGQIDIYLFLESGLVGYWHHSCYPAVPAQVDRAGAHRMGCFHGSAAHFYGRFCQFSQRVCRRMTDRNFIQVQTLHRHFQMGTEIVHALDGVDVTIEQGEFMGIVGPSGSGKSTLLYLIGGLDQPTSGEIWVDGTDIATLDEDGLAQFRQKSIGFIFQSFNLIPTMTAIQNVEFPMLFARVAPKERHERAKHALELVGLGDRISHKPTELSGGQQQRVSIARSLVNNPAIILADEPTGNLDSKSGGEVIGILQQLNRDEKRTVIMVTHDQSLLAATTRHIQILDGRVLADIRGNYEQQSV